MPLIKDEFFTPFKGVANRYTLPDKFTFSIDNKPHPLCLLAAEELQLYLKTQSAWQHNFGLIDEEEGSIIGKMFGVLVVKTQQNEIGYLAAFSGKLAGGNHHAKFVPPVFDSLTMNSFLNNGMKELTRINLEIKELEELKLDVNKEYIHLLKTKRKSNSIALQNKLFDNYTFLNKAGKEKNLNSIFKKASYKNPPSGAGECAGPKLLQYAFKHTMQPLTMAEFWWGQSPKSATWKHGQFYPCCKEKCEPILVHMLEGIDD
jgi:tRNA pseudouridine32 synthase/23S rRNA pseudouridine746 synthase